MAIILLFMLGKAMYMGTGYWVIFAIYCTLKVVGFIADVAVKTYKKMNGDDD